jgi:CBS domain-containing protein
MQEVSHMKVETIMTRDVASVTPETPLKVVAGNLLGFGISGMPVCDRVGHVVGVVSESDVLFKEVGPDMHGRALFPQLERKGKEDARTAGEAMTSPAVVIEPKSAVWEAARKMLEHHVNRLPVVDDGRLVGIVTRSDLVRAFVRPDAELERELVDDVMRRTLWIDTDRVDVDVELGEVRLSGEVDTKTDAEMIAEYATRVPGVVGVESDLRWSFDDRSRRTRNTRIPRRV